MKKVLITAKVSPEVDGVACGIAYAYYLNKIKGDKEYVTAFEGTLHPEINFILEKLRINLPKPYDSYDEFIMVDFSEPLGLPTVVDLEKVIEVIDHREFPSYGSFPNAEFHIELIGAAATLIVEWMLEKGMKIPENIATLLRCAIASNTMHFLSVNTVDRDKIAFKNLEKFIQSPENLELHDVVLEFKSKYALDHLEETLKSDMKGDYDSMGGMKRPVVYQLEVADSKPFIERKEEIFESMNNLYPDREHQFLVIQSLKDENTSIVCLNKSTEETLRSKLGELIKREKDNVIELKDLVLRKGIINELKK